MLQGYDSCVDCIHDAETNNIDIQLSWSGRGIDNHRVHGVNKSSVDKRTCTVYLLVLACTRACVVVTFYKPSASSVDLSSLCVKCSSSKNVHGRPQALGKGAFALPWKVS